MEEILEIQMALQTIQERLQQLEVWDSTYNLLIDERTDLLNRLEEIKQGK